jgi:DNA-binding response OmpR family regulator
VIANLEPATTVDKRSEGTGLTPAFSVSRWTFRVLIVASPGEPRNQLERALQAVGYRTFSLERPSEIRAFLTREACDALILDLDQLNHDRTSHDRTNFSHVQTGLMAFHDLRRSGLKIPAMVLGSHNGLEQRIAAFDAGGDDFQAKPVVEAELLVRLRSILRRTNPNLALNLEWRGLQMDWAARMARYNGRQLPLNHTEFTLFEVLASVPGRVVSQRDLRPHLEISNETSLSEIVSGLHDKLGMNVIEAVAEGFRFPPSD